MMFLSLRVESFFFEFGSVYWSLTSARGAKLFKIQKTPRSQALAPQGLGREQRNIHTDTHWRPMPRRIRQDPDLRMRRRREWGEARREGHIQILTYYSTLVPMGFHFYRACAINLVIGWSALGKLMFERRAEKFWPSSWGLRKWCRGCDHRARLDRCVAWLDFDACARPSRKVGSILANSRGARKKEAWPAQGASRRCHRTPATYTYTTTHTHTQTYR